MRCCASWRAVNDACSDAGRQLLAVHVPDVIGRNSSDPPITAALHRYCADTGLRRNPGDAGLAAGRQAAVERLDRLRRDGPLRRIWHAVLEPNFRAAAGVTPADAAQLTASGGDGALLELLLGALAAYEAAAGELHPNAVATRPTTAAPNAPTDTGGNHG